MEHALPKHIAIIMDGNGRWAKERNRPRSFGHSEGLKAAKRVIAYIAELHIPYVTLYVFSTENWKRPLKEINFLMSLISAHLKKEYTFYDRHNIQVIFSGDITKLPQEVQKSLIETAEHTREHSGTTVNLAINYGGRDELVRAVNSMIESRKSICTPVNADDIASYLDQPDIPDPDLVIRSAGEKRLSNFLVWESAYAELFFSDTLWPDWKDEQIDAALEAFDKRTRKYGGVRT